MSGFWYVLGAYRTWIADHVLWLALPLLGVVSLISWVWYSRRRKQDHQPGLLDGAQTLLASLQARTEFFELEKQTEALLANVSALSQLSQTIRTNPSFAKLGHEMLNALASIRLRVETLEKAHQRSHRLLSDLREETRSTIRSEGARLARLVVGHGLALSYGGQTNASYFVVRELLEDTARLFSARSSQGATVPDLDQTLSVRVGRSPEHLKLIFGVRDRWTQAMINLVKNAIEAGASQVLLEATDEAVPVSHSQGSASATKPSRVEIRVHDNGSGVPEALHKAILQGGFTTKTAGSGVGLTVVADVARHHGGSLWIGTSQELGGALFCLAVEPIERGS